MLELQAKETYAAMDAYEKKASLKLALKDWNGDLIFIHIGYKREIWKKDRTTGLITLIGQWDLNNAEIYKYLPKMLQTTKTHPFFFYVGGSLNFGSANTTGLLSARIGSFLYKDKWDVALSGTFNVTGDDMNTITNAELGLLSKVYFPIQKYDISPYVGAGIALAITSSNMSTSEANFENTYWKKMALVGISWYIGPGSLDVGSQIGNDFNVTLGYTFSF